MTRIHDTWADNDTPLTLELYYSGSWHDITADLSDDGWTVTRNPPDPPEFSCLLDNAGGKYSPRNPLSALYGLVGRNTPIRAKVTTGGATYVRFYGEVSAWPQRWTTKGTAYTPIAAAGIRRRLGQGASPLHSPMRRSLTGIGDPLIAYWPMEDEEDATVLAAVKGTAAWITGSVALAASSLFVASLALPTLETGRITAAVPPYTNTGESQVRWLSYIPAGTATDTTIAWIGYSGGTIGYSEVIYTTATGGTLTLRITNYNGSLAWQDVVYTGVNGKLLWLSVELWQDGADVAAQLSTMDTAGTATSDALSSPPTGETIGTVRSVRLNPDRSTLTDVVAGHVTVEDLITDPSLLADTLAAHAGETAADRITRLCGEEGVPVTITGTASGTELLGPQTTKTLLDLLDECAESDLGVLCEARDTGEIEYRTRESMETQDPAVTIAYSDNLLLPFEPDEDDKLTRNKVTVTRAGGTSHTSEVTTGPLSTQAPPNGVGVYDEGKTLPLATDGQVPHQASWRAHKGTVDEARWPRIGIELAHPTFVASTSQTAAVLGLDIGDRIVVTTLPEWMPPDDVDQLVLGYTDAVTPKRYKVTLNCEPASPYRVGIWDDASFRYSGDGTVLAGPLTVNQATFAGASCLSVAGSDPADDNDVRVRASLADWTPAAEQALAAKYVNSGNQRSWAFDVTTSGYLHLYLSTNGSGFTGVTSTAATGFTNGTYHWVRWSRVAATGVVKFWTSSNGATWTQLGSDVASGVTGTLYASTGMYQLGARSGTSVTSAITGTITAIEILDEIDGANLVSTEVDDWTDGYLRAGIGTTVAAQASSDLEVTNIGGISWGHDDGDYDVIVGGERMTVSTVGAAGATQTLTVTRSVNGVVKSHSSGTAVELFAPNYWSL